MTDPVVAAAPIVETPPATDPAAQAADPVAQAAAQTAAPVAQAAAQAAAPVAQPATPAADPAPAEGWGADWRQKYAGEDAKVLARLERYQSPKAALDALLEGQRRISAGEIKKPLAADATPEQLAAWRAENAIPEKAEGYLEKLPEGLVLGEEDKAIFSSLAESLHAKNASPEVAHAIIGWYNEFTDKELTKRVELDAEVKTNTIGALRAEWGADYAVNMNIIGGMLEKAPSGVKDRVLGARAADGSYFMEDPAVLNWLANQARAIEPVVTLVPNSSNPAQGVESEIAQIETMMRINRSAYNKDEKVQARYRALLDGRAKMQARA